MSFLLPAVGAGLNYFGAREANKSNERIARDQMSFQQKSNREQMQFQERMSNTSYQRAMQDMQEAGLNPVLAFNQGGASSPSGASSQGSAIPVKNQFSGAVSSAMQMKQLEAQLEQTRAGTALLKADLPEKLAKAKMYSPEFGAARKMVESIFPWLKASVNTALRIPGVERSLKYF